eukprot:symbB.v1.2.031893.t1/scaffold3751.1/size50939/2
MHLQASLGGEAVRHRGSIWLEDEVDRTALAKTARTSHVILATSRPETLEKAERCYRVCQQNRASRIDAILLEQAAEVFCEHDCLDRSILLVWSCGLIFMGPARAGPRTSQATLQDIRS